MARKEEIRNAIDAIIPILPPNNGRTYEQALMATGFEAGAIWADEHLNLESLWHDASEEPQGDEWHIAYIDVFGLIHSLKCPSVTFDTFPSLAKFAAGVGMQRWAYISDLLPKGGRK